MKFIIFILFLFGTHLTNGQATEFIAQLKNNPANEIIVFQSNCKGCFVSGKDCDEYKDHGNPWNRYILWKNKNKVYVKKFNNCGNSKNVRVRNLKFDPFSFVKKKELIMDTTQLQFPLSFNREDSTWFETRLSHYKYYFFEFPTYSIKKMMIFEYAFKNPKYSDDDFKYLSASEKRNIPRYEYNNKTAIKVLLDEVSKLITKNQKKFKIKN